MDKQHPFLENSVKRAGFFGYGRCCFAVLIIRTHCPLQLLEYYFGIFLHFRHITINSSTQEQKLNQFIGLDLC